MDKYNDTKNNQKKKTLDDKIKNMQLELQDSEKCREFAQKLVQYIEKNSK